MKSYNDFLIDAEVEIEKISNNEDVIIIGDNASGKSDLIRKYALKMIDKCYYIDAVNRSFDSNSISSVLHGGTNHGINIEMIRQRLDDEKYNREDYFANNDKVERWFLAYKDVLAAKVRKFFQNNFCFRQEVDERGIIYKVFVDDQEWRLSSGYQAVLRILSELLLCEKYYQSSDLVVIIDEIDQFLSASNAAKFFNFIRNEFPHYRFVVTTHSADLLVNSTRYKLIVLKNNEYIIYDGDDFDTLTSVNTLFASAFKGRVRDNERDYTTRIDDELAGLLNRRIGGEWNEEDELALRRLKEKKLTGSQKLLYVQIRDWNFE